MAEFIPVGPGAFGCRVVQHLESDSRTCPRSSRPARRRRIPLRTLRPDSHCRCELTGGSREGAMPPRGVSRMCPLAHAVAGPRRPPARRRRRSERGQLAEAQDAAGVLLAGLDAVLTRYANALQEHAMPRPY
ncbi:DUF6959 family protein [Streptomyces sp. NPDC048751]|uniref:DUF6959 family protein n=1 Tax=Streptomyces sp. NPDC048751 TaxID=3365591 RepID=UPI0037176CC3